MFFCLCSRDIANPVFAVRKLLPELECLCIKYCMKSTIGWPVSPTWTLLITVQPLVTLQPSSASPMVARLSFLGNAAPGENDLLDLYTRTAHQFDNRCRLFMISGCKQDSHLRIDYVISYRVLCFFISISKVNVCEMCHLSSNMMKTNVRNPKRHIFTAQRSTLSQFSLTYNWLSV